MTTVALKIPKNEKIGKFEKESDIEPISIYYTEAGITVSRLLLVYLTSHAAIIFQKVVLNVYVFFSIYSRLFEKMTQWGKDFPHSIKRE